MKLFKGDKPLLFSVVGMSLFGVLMVYSASYYNAQITYGDALFFVKKQLVGLAIGLVGMLFFSMTDYRKLKKGGLPFLIVSLVLLALVFVPGLGKSNYGATRWIGVGPITIQPSELAKYAFVLFSAGYMAKDPARMRTFRGILPVLLSGGATCALILIEPNMSVTMCVGLLMLSLLFLGGMKLSCFFSLCVPVLIAVPVLILIEPYRLKRLMAFLDPWASPTGEGYQLIQSLYALGNGGWFGTGLFASRQKYRFLPFAESDFILAIIGEELGYVGIFCFFLLAAFIVWRGFVLSSRCKDAFGYLLGVGITLVYGIQVVVNAMVVSGTIPPTGLPLPLVSAGNTSLIVTLCSFGLLSSLGK